MDNNAYDLMNDDFFNGDPGIPDWLDQFASNATLDQARNHWLRPDMTIDDISVENKGENSIVAFGTLKWFETSTEELLFTVNKLTHLLDLKDWDFFRQFVIDVNSRLTNSGVLNEGFEMLFTPEELQYRTSYLFKMSIFLNSFLGQWVWNMRQDYLDHSIQLLAEFCNRVKELNKTN